MIVRTLPMLALLMAAFWPRTASACSPSPPGFQTRSKSCETKQPSALPPNLILPRPLAERLADPTLFDRDDALSARLACASDPQHTNCPELSRLRPGALAGTTVRETVSSCELDATIGAEADTTPPSRPRIADVVIDIKTDPADTGCFSCPDLDTLTVFVTNVSDDRAPRSLMYLAIYVGNTPDEASSRTTIDHMIEIYDVEPRDNSKVPLDPAEGPPAVVQAVLGMSLGHERTQKGLLRAGPLCFAVETLDWAGNFSPRSEPVCLDHTNESDPRIRKEEGSTACSTHGRPVDSFVPLLIAIAGVRLSRRAQSRRTARS